MDQRLFLVAFLACTGLQAIEGGQHYGGRTTTTTEDPPVSKFIPLPVSYNMTTQWLGQLRDSYILIIRFETSQRLQNSRQVATDVKRMSEDFKSEMNELVVSSAGQDRPCVEKNTELGLQVLSTVDEELMSCAQPLVDMIDTYDEQLDTILKKVAAQDEAQIYTKCLPVETRLTRKILERVEECFRTEYRAAMDSFYYPIGHLLFTTVTEMSQTFARLESSATRCGQDVLSAHAPLLSEKLEGMRKCANSVAMPGYAPHSRTKRGFGKKLRKAWKKVRNGIKKLCNRIPCKVGYSVPLPGK